MNSLTVKFFDVRRKRIGHYFLDMCATTGTDAAKASVIFESMNNAIKSNCIPWTNCGISSNIKCQHWCNKFHIITAEERTT